jgi:hypothetical protein
MSRLEIGLRGAVGGTCLALAALVFGWLDDEPPPSRPLVTTSAAEQGAPSLDPGPSNSEPDHDWAPEQRAVGSFSATGSAATDPFTVCGPWSIHWDVDGGPLEITIRDAQGLPLRVAVRAHGPLYGEHEEEQGGTWYLDVVAEGSWNTTIIDNGVGRGPCGDEDLGEQQYVNGQPAG